MGFWEALLLGIVQGLTEFLPVSSSGHLALFTELLAGNRLAEETLLFTLLVHAATALATLVVLRKDIAKLIQGVFQKDNPTARHYIGKIMISMLPAVGVGLFFEKEITTLFGSNLVLVGAMLCVTALLLFFTDHATEKQQSITYKIAFIIGVAQAVAILPGISRSGATIATALLVGAARPGAARFSFLMVIPLILGSMTKTFIDNGAAVFETVDVLPLLTGFVAALISGIMACMWMIALVNRSKLSYFGVYCLVTGIITSIIAWA